MADCLESNLRHLYEDRYEGINPQVWNHDSRESVSDVMISTADGVNELSAKQACGQGSCLNPDGQGVDEVRTWTGEGLAVSSYLDWTLGPPKNVPREGGPSLSEGCNPRPQGGEVPTHHN